MTAPDDFDAVRLAREVTGLYGDPAVTWGIGIEAWFETPLDPDAVAARMTDLVARFPHLGAPPLLERSADADFDVRREEVAAAPFGEGGRLLHVLLDETATRILVTAHHGVCDGLGLVALLSAAAGVPIVSSARGVGETPAPRSFLGSSVLRLLEAVFRPPARFSGAGPDPVVPTGDLIRQVVLEGVPVNGARVCHALLDVHANWPRRRNGGGRRFMVIMGASRREGAELLPDRRTTFLRIPLVHGNSLAQVAATLRATDPEPDFPETSAGGIGPMITRLLRSRLGYTVNVSNVGVLTGEGLVRANMYPAMSGPMAFGVGLLTVGDRASVSLRMRRSEHTEAEVEQLAAALAEHLRVNADGTTRV